MVTQVYQCLTKESMMTDLPVEVDAETGIVMAVVPAGIKVSPEARDQLRECEKFLNGIASLDRRIRLWKTLNGSLEHIGRIQQNYPNSAAKLYSDFAPLSFGWCAGNLVGGLIFHGSHDGFGDGGFPSLSVSLDNTEGWQLHT